MHKKLNALDYAIGALIVFAFLSVMSWSDRLDEEATAAHKAETIAAARQAAHEKAQRLRDAKLLDDANRMLYPIAQARLPQ